MTYVSEDAKTNRSSRWGAPKDNSVMQAKNAARANQTGMNQMSTWLSQVKGHRAV